jgi:methionine-rich copper-binding protein CopC
MMTMTMMMMVMMMMMMMMMMMCQITAHALVRRDEEFGIGVHDAVCERLCKL